MAATQGQTMSTDFGSIDSSRKTLVVQVQALVWRANIKRALVPGSRIDRNKLAELPNLSLVPVREALKYLEAEGLITIIPRQGSFVTEVSREHLDYLSSAQQTIEGQAMYHAIKHLMPAHFGRLN